MSEFGAYKHLHFIPSLSSKEIRMIVECHHYLHGIYLDYAIEYDENDKPVAGWVATSRDFDGWHCHGEGKTVEEAINSVTTQIVHHTTGVRYATTEEVMEAYESIKDKIAASSKYLAEH